jgi:CRP/FNR family cyclic AMP-dependent transcriptional regulator
MIEVTTTALAAHPFLRGMPPGHLEELAASALVAEFSAGTRIFEDGGFADRFWLVRSGYVSLDMHVPGVGPVVIETVGMGELIGWSWLFPPYRWAFGAVCVSPLEAFQFNGPEVRARCVADPALGYDLTLRLIQVLSRRLHCTQTRLVARPRGTADMY